MTAAIVPFRTAARRQVDEALAAIQAHTIHETRRLIFECRQIRAESRRIQRGYEERQLKIEVQLAGIEASAAKGEGG